MFACEAVERLLDLPAPSVLLAISIPGAVTVAWFLGGTFAFLVNGFCPLTLSKVQVLPSLKQFEHPLHCERDASQARL